jgi:transcriptional regulator with XRE-family HTH domain
VAGRPSKYDDCVKPHLMMISAWCRDGATDKDIADRLGISMSAFSQYKLDYTELKEALKKNKEIIDTEVENALLKRALGYSYEEVTTEIEESPTGKKKKIKKTTKQVVPDVTAQAIWLQNRNAAKWRRNQEPQINEEAIKRLDDILDGVNRVMSND